MRLIKKLPNPFLFSNGKIVSTLSDWEIRRSEICQMMLDLQYGTMPPAPETVRVETIDSQQIQNQNQFDQLRFIFIPDNKSPEINFDLDVKFYRPSSRVIEKRKKTLNNFGQDGLPALIYVGDLSDMDRISILLDNGYCVLSYHNNQLEPMEMGKPIVGPARDAYQRLSAEYTWGSISVWAWGAIRLLEYARTLPEVDSKRIMVSGHSRNGKTALLAGSTDDRFALVNPAGSGCAGAGSYLALDEGCEDLAALTSRDRWWAWTQAEFEKWTGQEESLPFDQHFLMGLVAPRPLLRTEGIEDEWANPKGTAVAFLATQPIYSFLKCPSKNGIYVRPGGHYQSQEDFEALRVFADWHLFGLFPTDDFPHTNFHQLPFNTDELRKCFDWD